MFPAGVETRHDRGLPRDTSHISEDVKARHRLMVDLVETMLSLHKALPKARTPHEQESLQRLTAGN